MGMIIAKLRRKKTTYEVLNKLEDEINSIEEFRRNTEQTQKKMVGRFIFISVCVYFITALVLYFYFFPASASERLLYIIPLIIIPVLLIFIKRILTWYYNRKIFHNQKKLATLKDEKKKILEEVMDKETYKVAKTILEKFAPDQVKKVVEPLTPARPSNPPTLGSMQLTGVRYRGPQTQQRPAITFTPASSLSPAQRAVASTPLPLPRGILPKDRSVLDKMVDYLVGDGPSNRYALICKNCSSHNGMALREEFDYLSFRCCYCMTFNPARKQRPLAPKLEASLYLTERKSDLDENDSSSSESDEEGPIVEEPNEREDNNVRTDEDDDDNNKTGTEEIGNNPTNLEKN